MHFLCTYAIQISFSNRSIIITLDYMYSSNSGVATSRSETMSFASVTLVIAARREFNLGPSNPLSAKISPRYETRLKIYLYFACGSSGSLSPFVIRFLVRTVHSNK